MSQFYQRSGMAIRTVYHPRNFEDNILGLTWSRSSYLQGNDKGGISLLILFPAEDWKLFPGEYGICSEDISPCPRKVASDCLSVSNIGLFPAPLRNER